MTLRDAILEETGVDVLAHRERDALAAAIARARHRARPEPRPGRSSSTTCCRSTSSRSSIQPTFVIDYPVELSPFAKAHRTEPGLVERFEAFVDGMEIANAFTELNDPDEQRARFEAQARYAAAGRRGGAALRRGLRRGARARACRRRAASGSGIDRLVMVLGERRSIREVVLFPAMRD